MSFTRVQAEMVEGTSGLRSALPLSLPYVRTEPLWASRLDFYHPCQGQCQLPSKRLAIAGAHVGRLGTILRSGQLKRLGLDLSLDTNFCFSLDLRLDASVDAGFQLGLDLDPWLGAFLWPWPRPWLQQENAIYCQYKSRSLKDGIW